MPFMLLLLMMNMKYEIWKWWIWNMNVKLQSCQTKTLRHHSVPRRSIAPRILWWPWRHRVGQLSRPELSHHLEVSSTLQAAKASKDLVAVQRMGWVTYDICNELELSMMSMRMPQIIWMFTGFSWADSAIHPCFRLLEKVYDYIKHCQSQPASNPGSSPWHPQAQRCFLWLETICGKHRPCWSPAASSSTGLASLHRHVQKRQASTPVLALWYSLMWWSF